MEKPKHNLLKKLIIAYLLLLVGLYSYGSVKNFFDKRAAEKEKTELIEQKKEKETANDNPNTNEKVDDWEYKVQTYKETGPTVKYTPPPTFKESLNPRGLAVLLLVVPLNFSLVFAGYYIFYRIIGVLIRISNPKIRFGDKPTLFKVAGLAVLGLISSYISMRLKYMKPTLDDIYGWSLNYAGIYAKGAGTWALNILPWIAVIYLLTCLIREVINLLRKKPFPMKRRLFIVGTMFLYAILLGIPRAILGNLTGANISVDSVSLSGPSAGNMSYNSVTSTGMSGLKSIGTPRVEMAPTGGIPTPSVAEDNIGLSTGGAKDINNFRQNILNSYLPLPTDVTYEGLFYDYYFETGQKKPCDQLFCPTYSYALTKDPFAQEYEEYVTVGLNSGIKESDFARKKLNLVVVLDISGSMSSSFNKYYYDQAGKQVLRNEDADYTKSKMRVANESVVAMLNHLQPGDSFGMVLFDSTAFLAKPMTPVEVTDMEAIKKHILELYPRGGTNMESGLRMGTGLFDEYTNLDPAEYENRIIFLTDAQPNTGSLSPNTLGGMAKANADKGIYTTFIGIGVDFNTELIELITKIKGSNYYAVHDSTEFSYRMDEGFDYMVTPLVFDLSLQISSPDYEIEKVFGSPEASEATGEILKVNTLFPSDSKGGEVKGGVILVKLKKKVGTSAGDVEFTASYTDRNGQPWENTQRVTFDKTNRTQDGTVDYFEHNGIRKAILLTRYANLLKNWMLEERNYRKGIPEPLPLGYTIVNDEDGIVIPPERFMLSPWERQSMPLNVSAVYKVYMNRFKNYFESEMAVIGDDTMQAEVDVLKFLIQ